MLDPKRPIREADIKFQRLARFSDQAILSYDATTKTVDGVT